MMKISVGLAILLFIGGACIPLSLEPNIVHEPVVIEVGGDPASTLSEVEMVGATPSETFQSTGHVQFSVLPSTPDNGEPRPTSLLEMDVAFRVQNDDGSHSDCVFVEETIKEGREISSAALVIDDSGSMERSYTGQTCPTCPHDPLRQRASASAELIGKVFGTSLSSGFAIYDFGPDPDAGRLATRVLSSLTSDIPTLEAGLNRIDGSQPVGTPLWDALGEVISEHGAATDQFESDLSKLGPVSGEVGRLVLVISDGQDSASETHDLESVLRLAAEQRVVVHAIGLGPASALDENTSYLDTEQVGAIRALQDLARRSDGFYGSVDSPESMRGLFQNIALSMTDGYFVGTYACQPRRTSNDSAPRATAPGERLRGLMLIEGQSVPWSVIAP